jgi:hypothetical protein
MTVAVAPLYFQNGRPAEINSTEHTLSIPAVSISGTLTLEGDFASPGPMTFSVNDSERSRIGTDGGYIHSGANTTRAGTTISNGFGGNHIVWAGKDLSDTANETSIASILNVVGTSQCRNQIIWYAQREAAGGGGDEWQEVTWRQAFCVDSSAQMGLVWVGGGSASFMNGSYGIGHWGHTFPTADNTYNNGNSSYRWAAIYAANGTIQTSDRRLKKDVETIAGANAIAFVNALRPVTYKWKDGGADIFYEKDADGKQLPPREVRRAGRRIHSGFIAQEVKDVIDAQPGVAEAVWTKEGYDADDKPTQGLAYAEFIAPVVAALQAALAKIEALEARVTALGG